MSREFQADDYGLRPLIVPGLRNSGDGHWQTRWETEIGARRVIQHNWNVADLARWSRSILAATEGVDPVLLIAHSFGCLASVSAVAELGANVGALLLVAPASPSKFDLLHQMPRKPLPCPAILVGSESDPWLSLGEARQWARLWDCRFINLGDAGHINTDSGYGPWSEGLNLLAELGRRAQRRLPGGKRATAGLPQFLY